MMTAYFIKSNKQDLCRAALSFASDTLKPGGHFVCKFYQGAEDKALELLLKKMFARVHREKPESSRSVSPFCLFVCLFVCPIHCLSRSNEYVTGVERGLLCGA